MTNKDEGFIHRASEAAKDAVNTVAVALLALGGSVLASSAMAAEAGTAIVRVSGPVTDGLTFSGTPGGVTVAGELTATELAPGTYTSSLAPVPGMSVTTVSCDDAGSASASSGDAATGAANFAIDPGETVTCLFTLSAEMQSASESAAAGSMAGSSGVNPFQQPDEHMDKMPVPGDLPADAGSFDVPKGDLWQVSNHTGAMDCGMIKMPLKASSERGTLSVSDDGQHIIGTGFAEGTAPLTMTADALITGRYSGSVGDFQDGVAMTIDFYWQLVNDEFIIGYLTSTVNRQGMTCNMFRTFDLRYVGD